jgi:hypothetical protein
VDRDELDGGAAVDGDHDFGAALDVPDVAAEVCAKLADADLGLRLNRE